MNLHALLALFGVVCMMGVAWTRREGVTGAHAACCYECVFACPPTACLIAHVSLWNANTHMAKYLQEIPSRQY